jgi:hypothetical protein
MGLQTPEDASLNRVSDSMRAVIALSGDGNSAAEHLAHCGICFAGQKIRMAIEVAEFVGIVCDMILVHSLCVLVMLIHEQVCI